MNKFSSLLVVSLLSGTITLGAYKLFFDAKFRCKKQTFNRIG